MSTSSAKMKPVDTIFALSSGPPPAAIAIIRISGPAASGALISLAGRVPQPRLATLRMLRTINGELLDHALVLWFPGPTTATGEDLAELHVHGGRAVVAAVERALEVVPGLRRATAGEFTRRAFANGCIDLAEAEGLADLLRAETELQRRQAIALASGALSFRVTSWRDEVLRLSALVEAALDFGDEDDVGSQAPELRKPIMELLEQLAALLEGPRSEVLYEGVKVVLAGPPNCGKSSLFNALLAEDAAITAPVAGTTRDVLTRQVALNGVPFTISDTAGLREHTDDQIEAIGIDRAMKERDRADLVLWLGAEGKGSGSEVWEIDSFADLSTSPRKAEARHRISSVTGDGLVGLVEDLARFGVSNMPSPSTTALNARQSVLLEEARAGLKEALATGDLLLAAEGLRVSRSAFDRLIGRAASEDMLDMLFSGFCIGK